MITDNDRDILIDILSKKRAELKLKMDELYREMTNLTEIIQKLMAESHSPTQIHDQHKSPVQAGENESPDQ